jgi:hypothetical protein
MHIFMIIDLVKNHLKLNNLNSSSQLTQHEQNEKNSLISQRYLYTIHQLIYHLYSLKDFHNLFKIITDFKVLKIFVELRMQNLNEWTNFCEYIRKSTNLKTFRSMLIARFTDGLPNYKIELLNNSLRIVKDSMNSHLELNNPKKSTKSDDLIIMYTQRIDHLFNSNNKNKNDDSDKLLLINRSLIFIDLARHLKDTFFESNYSLCLLQSVIGIVKQSYPLNGMEKLYYSHLLQEMVKISQDRIVNDEKGLISVLKYSLQGVEILKDLFSTFFISDISYHLKTQMELIKIRNRISYLHSSMALILLKLNSVEEAEMFLQKANMNENIDREIIKVKNVIKFERMYKIDEKYLKDKYDRTKLIDQDDYNSILVNDDNNNNNNDDDNDDEDSKINLDDAGSFSARYNFYLISGLLEVKKENYKEAYNLFELSLNFSIKWFGSFHTNTSKIYHCFGCFYSLQNTQFYNQRKAELYLRKALNILNNKNQPDQSEQHQSTSLTFKLKDDFLSEKFEPEGSLPSDRSVDSYKSDESSFIYENKGEIKSTYNESNTIAEILFDLGCLLSTFDSNISKKESIDYLRQSLDIKILLLGIDNDECQVIINELNKTIEQLILAQKRQHNSMNIRSISSATSTASNLSRSRSATTALTSTTATTTTTTTKRNSSKIKLRRYIEKLNISDDTLDSDNQKLNEWIKKNSIIEIIPKKKRPESRIQSSSMEKSTDRISGLHEKSFYNEYIKQTQSIYIDDFIFSRSSINNFKNANNSTMNIMRPNKTPQHYTVRSHLFSPQVSTTPRPKTNNTNSKNANTTKPTIITAPPTLNGPNSTLRSLLNEPLIRNNIKSKVLKNIYYKTAWYDLPAGSSKRRFKNYIKLTPNV